MDIESSLGEYVNFIKEPRPSVPIPQNYGVQRPRSVETGSRVCVSLLGYCERHTYLGVCQHKTRGAQKRGSSVPLLIPVLVNLTRVQLWSPDEKKAAQCGLREDLKATSPRPAGPQFSGKFQKSHNMATSQPHEDWVSLTNPYLSYTEGNHQIKPQHPPQKPAETKEHQWKTKGTQRQTKAKIFFQRKTQVTPPHVSSFPRFVFFLVLCFFCQEHILGLGILVHDLQVLQRAAHGLSFARAWLHGSKWTQQK